MKYCPGFIAIALSVCAFLASSPASAQFACTTTTTDITCTNTGTAANFSSTATGANQNDTVSNSGTANGFTATTAGGGNATASNSGSNAGGGIGILAQTLTGGTATASNSGSNAGGGTGILAATFTGGNATASNSGSNTGGNTGILAETENGGNATASNSGSNTGGNTGILAETNNGGNATASNAGSNTGSNTGILAETNNGGNATASNSGSNTGGNLGILAVTSNGGNATASNSASNTGGNIGIFAETDNGGNATASNSGSNTGGNIGIFAQTLNGGNATATNSGSNTGSIVADAIGGGNASVTNSGSNTGGVEAETFNGGNASVTNSGRITGGITAETVGGGNASVINSGFASGTNGAITVTAALGGGSATLTNIVGGRVVGAIQLMSTNNIVNFQGGSWLQVISTVGPALTVNAGGAPFVVSGNQIAVLDPTTFALADRSLMNFTGEVSQMLQDRFAGMEPRTGGGGTALGFAGAPSSAVADQVQAAFSGVPSVAMSYASGASRPVLGKAAATPYYDTTIWASGFGGERKQRADGAVLAATDIAFGGAMGVDRIVNSNLRLGAFVGAGGSREDVTLGVQSIDATYVFGGGYGRFDWVAQYLDFSLYGGGITNTSTRQVANNTVASGLETASASYGGWFISPELTYGYRIPFNLIIVTPRVRLRYVGGQLDGYSETGSMQNLSVGRRDINDIEERGEVELSTVSGPLKVAATFGVIGLERLGNPNINTVLLGQTLSFVTPGQASAVGGVVGMRMEYRVMANASLFVAGEGIAMNDKSDSFAASGGAKVSF